MFRKIAYVVIVKMCLLTTLSGQEISPFVNHLTMADGMLDGVNYYITRDSKGFVWISSLNGLNRYDGSEVRQYAVGNIPAEVKGQYVQSKMFEDKRATFILPPMPVGLTAISELQTLSKPGPCLTPVRFRSRGTMPFSSERTSNYGCLLTTKVFINSTLRPTRTPIAMTCLSKPIFAMWRPTRQEHHCSLFPKTIREGSP